MAKENHKTRLLQYLKSYGSITSLEAIRDLGNTRLSAYIFKLINEDGIDIDKENQKVNTRFTKSDGTRMTTTVTKYILKK